MNKTIKSKNFTLRPYKKGDEESLIKNINDKDIYKYTVRIPYPYTSKHAKQWIYHPKNKADINFAIDIRRRVVGGIGLRNITKYKAEIGYWLGKKYWNKGIMTKALKLVTNYGFNKLKLKRIYCQVFSKNKASSRILEKIGYKREGFMRKYHLKDGKLLDSISYAKIK